MSIDANNIIWRHDESGMGLAANVAYAAYAAYVAYVAYVAYAANIDLITTNWIANLCELVTSGAVKSARASKTLTTLFIRIILKLKIIYL